MSTNPIPPVPPIVPDPNPTTRTSSPPTRPTVSPSGIRTRTPTSNCLATDDYYCRKVPNGDRTERVPARFAVDLAARSADSAVLRADQAFTEVGTTRGGRQRSRSRGAAAP